MSVSATISTRLLVLLAALALVGAACGGDDAEGVDSSVSCEFADLNLVTPGTLTVATGDPAFPPWIGVGDDNFDVPESKTGFEGGLVYALAAEMGFSDDQVVWVRTGFDEVITAGPKDWDFNIQQYSITEARDAVVDFSVPYYVTRQALVTFQGSPYETASSIDDLKDAKLGVALGTTSFDFVEDVIKPNTPVAVYDENVDVEAAMNADQLDGMVVDLPAAYYMTAVQIENGVIAGQFEEGAAAPDEYGMLFAEGNPLVSCVNAALNKLIDNGTVQQLEDEWLTQDGAIPIISGG